MKALLRYNVSDAGSHETRMHSFIQCRLTETFERKSIPSRKPSPGTQVAFPAVIVNEGLEKRAESLAVSI
jgi:hypothetical protein